jgi:hypothetical protein
MRMCQALPPRLLPLVPHDLACWRAWRAACRSNNDDRALPVGNGFTAAIPDGLSPADATAVRQVAGSGLACSLNASQLTCLTSEPLLTGTTA